MECALIEASEVKYSLGSIENTYHSKDAWLNKAGSFDTKNHSLLPFIKIVFPHLIAMKLTY